MSSLRSYAVQIRWHLSGTQWGDEYEIVSFPVAITVRMDTDIIGYRGSNI